MASVWHDWCCKQRSVQRFTGGWPTSCMQRRNGPLLTVAAAHIRHWLCHPAPRFSAGCSLALYHHPSVVVSTLSNHPTGHGAPLQELLLYARLGGVLGLMGPEEKCIMQLAYLSVCGSESSVFCSEPHAVLIAAWGCLLCDVRNPCYHSRSSSCFTAWVRCTP